MFVGCSYLTQVRPVIVLVSMSQPQAAFLAREHKFYLKHVFKEVPEARSDGILQGEKDWVTCVMTDGGGRGLHIRIR